MADKQDYNRHNREYDEEQQKQHFQSWETFWGRPGYGAPREVLRPNNYDDDCEYSDDRKQILATFWGRPSYGAPREVQLAKSSQAIYVICDAPKEVLHSYTDEQDNDEGRYLWYRVSFNIVREPVKNYLADFVC